MNYLTNVFIILHCVASERIFFNKDTFWGMKFIMHRATLKHAKLFFYKHTHTHTHTHTGRGRYLYEICNSAGGGRKQGIKEREGRGEVFNYILHVLSCHFRILEMLQFKLNTIDSNSSNSCKDRIFQHSRSQATFRAIPANVCHKSIFAIRKRASLGNEQVFNCF